MGIGFNSQNLSTFEENWMIPSAIVHPKPGGKMHRNVCISGKSFM